jgi:hypothetical protein
LITETGYSRRTTTLPGAWKVRRREDSAKDKMLPNGSSTQQPLVDPSAMPAKAQPVLEGSSGGNGNTASVGAPRLDSVHIFLLVCLVALVGIGVFLQAFAVVLHFGTMLRTH